MNVVDSFTAINSRVSSVEKAVFSQINPGKLKELPRLVKELKHSIGIIEESILTRRKSGSRGFSETKKCTDLEKFSERLKNNFEICDEKFSRMQKEVIQFQELFRDCLRKSDFKDKEDLILILKKENEVKQKLLNKYKLLVEKEALASKAAPEGERNFDAEFNKRFRTSSMFVKLLQEENAFLMSKNAEISEKVLSMKIEINRRLENVQGKMKKFWQSFSSATGKDVVVGAFKKKRKGIESALAEFGRHKSDFRKMLLRHEKFVEQVTKSGEGVLIEIQKEFGRLKKWCKGFNFLDLLGGKSILN